MKKLAILSAAVALSVAGPASAAQIFSLSYDMPNGSTGTFVYHDRAYPSPNNATDGAPLSGGSGDLTDGVAAQAFWFQVENVQGTGPYVGWLNSNTPSLGIQFLFSGSPTIDEIRIHVDNSLQGGVSQPAAYLVNGVPWAFSPLAQQTIGWVTLNGPAVTGNSLTLGMNYSSAWIFASEVEFHGTPGGTTVIPLPAAAWLLLGGLGVFGALGRRRARTAA